MTDTQFELMMRKLDAVTDRIDAVVCIGVMGMSEGKSQAEQIWLFTLGGLPPKKIAAILNTSPNAVRVALSNFRKSRRQRQQEKH
jgi:hypothetical protein